MNNDRFDEQQINKSLSSQSDSVLNKQISGDDTPENKTKTNQQEETNLLAAAVHCSHDSIVITTTDLDYPGPKIVFVNRAFTQMTGYQADEVIGKTPRILQGAKTERTIFQNFKSQLRNGDVFFGETVNYRKDGSEFYNQWNIEGIKNQQGKVTHYLAIQRDITEKKEAEKQLIYESLHDCLTNLYNRSWFQEKLQSCIEKANRSANYIFALLFLDLDNFKWVNDSLGHSLGDLFLYEVAQRLKKSIRNQDSLARWGEDEFTIIIENIQDLAIISNMINRILKGLQKPFLVDSQEIFTSVSIGLTLSNFGYENGVHMLQDADLAMYQAKSQGKSQSVIFNPTMRKAAVKRLSLETELHKALENQEFEIYYQPIVNTNDLVIVGFEALVRWQNPEKGLISPAEFIPIAEETRMIIDIGEWVLSQACKQAKQWEEQFPRRSLFVNVNLSPRQFKQYNLVDKIDAILDLSKCDRRLIKLEITESAIMGTSDRTETILHDLHDLGIKLCLDDFGTGYSSLSRLYQFPIDVLKIDGCFVRAIGSKTKKEKILKSIINLAHALEMDIVAEGVETEFQLDAIVKQNCQYVQGYLFGKPDTSENINKMLDSNI